jgi:hypothetical protein
MTSTLEGLRELASREGYKHLSVEEIHKSAASGCPFCAILKNNHKRNPHPAAYVRVFPRRPMLQDHKVEKYKLQSESTGHLFAIAKLGDLHSTVWDHSVDLDTIEAREYSEKSKLSGLRNEFGEF